MYLGKNKNKKHIVLSSSHSNSPLVLALAIIAKKLVKQNLDSFILLVHLVYHWK